MLGTPAKLHYHWGMPGHPKEQGFSNRFRRKSMFGVSVFVTDFLSDGKTPQAVSLDQNHKPMP